MNKYLEKVALNRLVKEIAKGTISKSPHQLASQGLIRSKDTYYKGYVKGNKALAKEVGARLQVPAMPTGKESDNMYGAIAYHGGGAVAMPTGSHGGTVALMRRKDQMISKDKLHGQVVLRHELHEVKEMNRQRAKGMSGTALTIKDQMQPGLSSLPAGTPGVKRIQRQLDELHDKEKTRGYMTPSVFKDSAGDVQGMHANLAVIGRESNDFRANPYSQHYHILRGARHGSEAPILKEHTGKVYSQDKITSSDLRRARAAKPDEQVHTASGVPLPSPYPGYKAK